MNTIIFDIDGVLADNKDYKDWFDNKDNFLQDKFDKQVSTFNSLEWGVKLIRALYSEGYNIVIITSRNNNFRDKTIKWLEDKIIPYHHLYTRDIMIDSVEYKLQCTKYYNDVLFVVEDNPELVKAYRNNGYVVLQPNNYYEE